MQPTLDVRPDADHYFDAEAADRPCRFVAKFCRHFEGRHAGKPFELLPWQRTIVRDVFGWRRRADGLRRFRELYVLTAKGAGKTPLLTAIGLYMLLGDGEAAAHVVSMASTFEQANLTFAAAKAFVAGAPPLAARCDVKQFQIRAPGYAKWTTISGKPNGRSGPRPSCVIADEVHEWPTGTDRAYDMLAANLFKRAQPLLMTATNAGDNRTCFAWQLHERAAAVLAGRLADPTLYPVIYEAPAEHDWRSEAAARAANPSIGGFVRFEQLLPELGKGEGRYRRLFLSQWVSGDAKWIKLDQWDAAAAAAAAPDPAELAAAPLYVGLDLSLGDDLCAAAYVYALPDRRFHVDAEFWLPRETAERYAREDATIPYPAWADAGHLTLTDGPTIGPAERLAIAAAVARRAAGRKCPAVCYDRYKADEAVATLEAAGLTCVPVAQGYTLTPGCAELERRLKERSLSVAANPVLRMCAENVEVRTDPKGNYWPVKPNAKGQYAGKRAAKIDGIAAIVTALTEARKHAFPAAGQRFTGTVASY